MLLLSIEFEQAEGRAMRASRGDWQEPVLALFRVWLLALTAFLASGGVSFAEDRAQLTATTESGYARLLFNFPTRLDLPSFKVKYDNNVLSVEFEQPILLTLPDIAAALPDYVAIARIDPDRRGVRFGLKAGFNVSKLEAGERLYVDLLPLSWQGLPPSLPPEVIAELGERAKRAAVLA